MRSFFTIIAACIALGGIDCGKKTDDRIMQENSAQPIILPGITVLFLDSYHESYEPNMKARSSLEHFLQETGVAIVYRFLDEKNSSDTALLRQRGANLFKEISVIKPDVIVLADDPIMKWVAEPFLVTQPIPLLFIGVNWHYNIPLGAPMTGQLEVELLTQLIDDLKTVSRGSRIGILTAKTATDEKSIQVYRDILSIKFTRATLVSTFDVWKQEFRRLQKEVDILIIRQNAGISGWDDQEAAIFCRTESRIPTGSPNLHMSHYVLLCYPKLNEEFGEYAGKKVIEILSGTAPQLIPLEKNRRTNRTINTEIAQRLGITFPAEFLETANFVPSNDEHFHEDNVTKRSNHQSARSSDTKIITHKSVAP